MQDSNADTHPARRTRATYRLRGISESFDHTSLENALCTYFAIEVGGLTIHSLAYDAPYGRSSRQKVATITFQTIPEMLKAGNRRQTKILLLQGGSEEQYFDTTFEGFTPLTPSEMEDDTSIDCILIHGWAGHSVGSFSSPDGDWFWPRDSLCREIPQFRVWLYGYPSDLQDSKSIMDVYEYADTFRRALADARKSKSKVASRPLIYIVHSLGGCILQDAISKMAGSDHIDDKINLNMTKGALLFGVPNQGMESQQLVHLLQEDDLPAAYMASLLNKQHGFKLRAKQVHDFYKACSRNNAIVYAFYETEKTPTVCCDPETQRWTRNGPPDLLVSGASATYGCSELRNMIPWKGGHNDMLKLRKGDIRYETLLHRLREVIQRIEKDQAPTESQNSKAKADDQADQVSHAINAGFDISETIREADELVRNHYRSGGRLLIQRLSGQELELENCYINLVLIDRLGGNKDQGRETSFNLEARLRIDSSQDQSIPLDKLFQSRQLTNGKTILPRRIFIQGRAGIGKTTLCKKMVYEYLQGRLESTLFDRLMWIPLRGLQSSQEYGWQELLRDTFKLTNPKWKEVREVYSKQFYNTLFLSRTLFLFDGLDEISSGWRHDDPMYDFLNTILRDVPNIIITSRPQANTFSMEIFDLDLETVGFTPDQVGTYIRNCVGDAEIVAKMEKAIANKPLIQGLLRIPIQLDALCYTWIDDDLGEARQSMTDMFSMDTSTTMTTLYQSIAVELCRKDLKSIGGVNHYSQLSSSEVLHKLENELDLLGEVAFQGLSSNIAEFNPRHWDKLRCYFYESKIDFSAIFTSSLERLSFLRTSDHGADYTKRNYHFIHLTFQEFFAAKHFVKHWQRGVPLICLYLTGASGQKTVTPFAFLQEEKYNPRYNIFWRFVAGLIPVTREVIRFFSQLHDEPMDLLGGAHLRILMYCFSEMVPYSDQRLRDLCIKEVDVLKKGLVREYHATGKTMLGTAAEFPERLLYEFLENNFELPYTETLSILEQRSVLQIQTVEAVICKLDSNYTMEVRLEAAKTLLKHSSVCSHPVIERIIDFLVLTLEDEDSGARKNAAHILGRHTSLPVFAIDTLIAVSEDECEDVRANTMIALGRQSSLPERAIDTLGAAVMDESMHVAFCAYTALGRHSPLSEASIDSLIAIFKDGYVCDQVMWVMEEQPSLPEAAIDILIMALESEDFSAQSRALRMLAKRPSLPESAIEALVAAALKNDNTPDVRREAANLLEKQSSLPEIAVDALKEQELSSKDVTDLLEQSSLSNSDIDCLIAMLRHDNGEARHRFVLKLNHFSSFPKRLVSALNTAVKDDEEWIVRSFAAQALGQQLCISRETIGVLITALQDQDKHVRQSAAEALGRQSSLPKRAIYTLIAALRDEKYVQEAASKALKHQSILPEDAIDALIAMLTYDSYEIYDVLHHQKIFYRKIEDLAEQDWLKIWSFWLKQGQIQDINCYVLQGALYLWSNGLRYQISTRPEKAFRLLKAVLKVSDDELWRKIAVTPTSVRETISATQDSVATVLIPRPAKRSRTRRHL